MGLLSEWPVDVMQSDWSLLGRSVDPTLVNCCRDVDPHHPILMLSPPLHSSHSGRARIRSPGCGSAHLLYNFARHEMRVPRFVNTHPCTTTFRPCPPAKNIRLPNKAVGGMTPRPLPRQQYEPPRHCSYSYSYSYSSSCG